MMRALLLGLCVLPLASNAVTAPTVWATKSFWVPD